MPDLKTPQKQLTQQPIKNLQINSFYIIHDGSPSGHPGLLIWKDDNANLYLAIKFGSSSNKENVELKEALSKEKPKSFYYKRLFLGKRKDFSDTVLTNLTINTEELNLLLQKFDWFNPVYSKNITGRNKHLYLFKIKTLSIDLRGPTYR